VKVSEAALALDLWKVMDGAFFRGRSMTEEFQKHRPQSISIAARSARHWLLASISLKIGGKYPTLGKPRPITRICEIPFAEPARRTASSNVSSRARRCR
jgi:hypothetical protein